MLMVVSQIASELSLKEHQVASVVRLLFEEECTIPFVARYRKEKTGSLDEVVLRDIRDRYTYLVELESLKKKYIKTVEELSHKNPEIKANFVELHKKFMACKTKTELEDLYLPFKPKRRTRAQVAKEMGLEPLLQKILDSRASLNDLLEVAKEFVHPADAKIDDALRVKTAEQALQGASDILAERISEMAQVRGIVRQLSHDSGYIISKKLDSIDAKGSVDEFTHGKDSDKKDKSKTIQQKALKYQNYFDYKEKITSAAAHRIMAIRRGEAEKILRFSIDVDVASIQDAIKSEIIDKEKTSSTVSSWLLGVVDDSYKRLLSPSIETEIRLELKRFAEEEAIKVFSKNLENLLLLPPIPGKVVMGVDPGIRTGSKLSVVSDTGMLMAYTTIYPDFQNVLSPKTKEAEQTVLSFLKDYKVQYIAVGNGTGSKEINALVKKVQKENDLRDIKRLFVNEAGASVYSTDQIAREEFPSLDPTIRSAISIARRLQDPLAELVKIDPRSIGVGQYQHDINVTKLKQSLEEVVESCVNKVGVNLNTASAQLLSYVSGIGPALARGFVDYRNKNGKYQARTDVLQVAGCGPKVFQQAAGFLRVPESTNPLDNSAVHPESYSVVEHISADLNKSMEQIIGQKALIDVIPLERYVTANVGMPTLKDIANELVKPGRDPREEGSRLIFSDDIDSLEDLKIDMELQGTVTNVTNFGAFVDVGVHQDGLVHLSELSDKFVKDPATVVSVGDILTVRVVDVDLQRRRLSLTCKSKGASRPAETSNNKSSYAPRPRQDGAAAHYDNKQQRDNRPQNKGQPQGRKPQSQQQKPREYKQQYTLDDLMAKFNRN